MALNSYISYHIDPKAFRESGEQNKLDEPIEVIPSEKAKELIRKRLSAPFTAPRKPTKLELEMLLREGLTIDQIADRWNVSLIRVREWVKQYKIPYGNLQQTEFI